MTFFCPSCSKQIVHNNVAWSRCDTCHAMVFPQTSDLKVIVAHESENIAARIGFIVAETGLWPMHAPNGAIAMHLLEKKHPHAAVLDVALPEVMSFQIIERIRSRKEFNGIKVILIASVFNHTAYKRRPTSLYGADDYVEQHHVHDLLPEKLCALLQIPAPSSHEKFKAIDGPDTRNELNRSERILTLARSIAADVALYHQQELSKLSKGERDERLDVAIDEGRRLLADMVGGQAAVQGDPIAEALAAIVAELRGGTA
ncbi:MAG: hypothetical protein JW841_01680 [Deltaproteobacteria bacterium]|nr:hypothetical protein [Deltaproteobacteria bacterium]